MNIRFTEITEADFAAIKEIYDYYILTSTSTYYTELISIDELKQFIPLNSQRYKSYMIEVDDECCGFCYLSQYKKRQAYDRTAEISIYLKNGFGGRGIGRKALDYLESVAREKRIHVLLAIISGDNTASIKLFESAGYEKCGHLKQIGEKFHRVLDVLFYQRFL
ncbi:MAG: N-acetyltransferase family protein [Bacteroidales bacterium]|nr:N-acetyltransferase family protein [Bacteroidales bacterium]